MRKIILFSIIFSFLFLSASNTFAETKINSTTGFVSGDIWYSKAKLVEGDEVKIYTAFWNGENTPINIKVSFFDKDILLGTRDVSIPALTLKDISISWKVTTGDHQIKATILKATSNQSGTNQDVSISLNEVKTESIFISKRVDASVPAEKLGELGEKVIDVLPKSVAEPVSSSVSDLDLFREKTKVEIEKGIAGAKEKIEANTVEVKKENNKTNTKDKEVVVEKKKDSLSGTEKPIAYLQFYLLSVALFIFSNTWLFYGIILFFIFLIIRFIYRKIRGR